MKIIILPLLAITLLLSGCGSISKKTVNDDGYAVTRTYFWKIPVYEEREWVEEPMPKTGAETMRWMDHQMEKTDPSFRIHLTPEPNR